MMRSYAEASRAFDRKDYLEIAVRNADFLLTRLRRDGRLLRTYKDGESKLNGYLEDYAYVIDGLLRALRSVVRPSLVRRGADAGGDDDRAVLGC